MRLFLDCLDCQWWFYTETLLHAQKLLHTDAFTRRRFYTQTVLHASTFTHTFTQTLLHTEAFTHRRFYTQAGPCSFTHTDGFTHRRFYTQGLLHTEDFTQTLLQRRFYTQTLLHTDTFTHKRFLHTDAYTLHHNFTSVFGDRTSFRAKGLRRTPCRWHCPCPRLQERNRKEGEGKRTRGEDVKTWGCEISRCEDEKMWKGEDEKMWRCEDVKSANVKMRRCEEGEDEKMWTCEDEQLWRCEDVKMSSCEDVRMWRWEDVKMRGCEDVKMIGGSLEVKLPTIWTDEKQSRAEAERRGRLEERRSEEKE